MCVSICVHNLCLGVCVRVIPWGNTPLRVSVFQLTADIMSTCKNTVVNDQSS